MDLFERIATKIIQEQEGIIGPIALEQAQKVPGITIHWDKHEVQLSGDQKSILDSLVDQYKHLFGQASVEVCKEAARDLIREIPQSQRPSLLEG